MSESMETIVPVSCASRAYEVHVGVGNLASVGAVARSWAAPSKKTPGRPPKAVQEAWKTGPRVREAVA